VTIRTTVHLVCDGRGGSGCHAWYDLGDDPTPAQLAARRRQAAEAGWQRFLRDGTPIDLCRSCNALRLAGEDVRPQPEAPAPLPRTIGEAAAWDRWRETQDGAL
jgi:hypothetical protein